MAVLPINTKIRGPAPISCKSRPKGAAVSSTKEMMSIRDQGHYETLGVRDAKGRSYSRERGRDGTKLIYSRP